MNQSSNDDKKSVQVIKTENFDDGERSDSAMSQGNGNMAPPSQIPRTNSALRHAHFSSGGPQRTKNLRYRQVPPQSDRQTAPAMPPHVHNQQLCNLTDDLNNIPTTLQTQQSNPKTEARHYAFSEQQQNQHASIPPPPGAPPPQQQPSMEPHKLRHNNTSSSSLPALAHNNNTVH